MGFNGRSDGGESSLVEDWRWKGDEEEFGDMVADLGISLFFDKYETWLYRGS